MSTKTNALFIKWLEEKEPFLLRLAKKNIALKSGLGASDSTTKASWYDQIISTVKEIAPSVIKARAQSKALKIQMKRASMGLPPLAIADYTPAIKISPEITPESEAALTRMAKGTIMAGAKRMMMYAIPAGIAAYFLFMRKRR